MENNTKFININSLKRFWNNLKSILDNKQNTIDDSLLTEQKSISDGINECYSLIKNRYRKIVHYISEIGEGRFDIEPSYLHVWEVWEENSFPSHIKLVGISELHGKEYLIRFKSNGQTLAIDAEGLQILWANNTAPEWEKGVWYEISIIDGFATFLEYR
jgi:hypothetical protein